MNVKRPRVLVVYWRTLNTRVRWGRRWRVHAGGLYGVVIAPTPMRSRWRKALSLKKSREVYEEMARPPEDTPQRRMVFERMREMAALRKRLADG
jgi:hypothetical protein